MALLGAGLLPAVSSTLHSLAEKRRMEYSRSCIKLVDKVENKYPLADIIMESCAGNKVNGNLEGEGSAKFHDGHSFEGHFQNGVMHGFGKYTWEDGVVYEGDFNECRITGEGKYTWPDGSTYIGEVLKGKRHGHGRFHCAVTGGTYTGSWVHGLREGKGKLVYDQSGLSCYEGEWANNQIEGYGVRKYKSGNVYEGGWHNNRRHGQGTMSWLDRGEKYTGDWVDGVQNGQGEHIWIVSGTDSAQYPLCNRYVGNWKNGVREGKGVFYYASGAVYNGEWVNNKKHGWGRFVFQSGKIYEGLFDSDKMADQQATEVVERALRPRTPLGSLIGDIDSSEQLARGSVTEKFNIEISRVIPVDADRQHELKQVHCVLLRYITQLKIVYHLYSSLDTVENDSSQHIMTRLQLWRLLRDCRIHHLGFTLYNVDIAIDQDPTSPTIHNPFTTFLMREFLQVLVFLAHYMYIERGLPTRNDSSDASPNGLLSRLLSELISTHILPLAGSPGGLLYGQTRQHTEIALAYRYDLWRLFEEIRNKAKKAVTVRDILLLLQNSGVVSTAMSASTAMSLLVKDDPLTYSDGCYNTEIKVTFLEFYEALLKCAVAAKWPSTPVSISTIHDQEVLSDHEQWKNTLQLFFQTLHC